MAKHQMKCLGLVTAVLVTGLGAVAPTASATTGSSAGTLVVRPGESIQKAVDDAEPGATVLVSPGTYRESVLVTRSDLTLRGAGGRTVITPGAERAGNACAQEGNGICVIGKPDQPVEDVHIRSLTVSGFKKNGVWATRTDRLTVTGVRALDNGTWGIAQERSTRATVVGNTARDNGDAGIFVANAIDREGGALDTKGTVVSGNQMSGNRLGSTLRRVRNLIFEHNVMTGNCGGVFAVGDESEPRTGDLMIRANLVRENNEYCPGNPRLAHIQGAGIVLTGVEDVTVTRNVVQGNTGDSPFAGGIVLFKSFVGAPNSDNVISHNVALDNGPADLADRDDGTGNRFEGNVCRVSEPEGQC